MTGIVLAVILGVIVGFEWLASPRADVHAVRVPAILEAFYPSQISSYRRQVEIGVRLKLSNGRESELSVPFDRVSHCRPGDAVTLIEAPTQLDPQGNRSLARGGCVLP